MSENAAAENVAEEKPKKKKDKSDPAPEPTVTMTRAQPAREAAAPHVYTAINDVKDRLDRMGGITKNNQTNYGDRYKFRGIDDMYNVLCGLTVEAGLVMIPRVVESRIEREDRAKAGTGQQTHVWVTVEVDYISTVDGTKHTGRYLGEAIDTSDKASNKAMSAAMKYACLMAFQIPTHGEPDDTEHYQTEVGHAKPAAPEYIAPKPKNSPKEGPRFDTSNAALDIAIALGDKITVCDSFATLFELAKDADKQPEPGRGPLMEKVHARTRILIEGCDNVKKLGEAKGIIVALGSPATLLATYNKRYADLRTPKPTEPAS